MFARLLIGNNNGGNSRKKKEKVSSSPLVRETDSRIPSLLFTRFFSHGKFNFLPGEIKKPGSGDRLIENAMALWNETIRVHGSEGCRPVRIGNDYVLPWTATWGREGEEKVGWEKGQDRMRGGIVHTGCSERLRSKFEGGWWR